MDPILTVGERARTLANFGLAAAVVLGGEGFLAYAYVAHVQHYRMVDDLVLGPLDDLVDDELKVHGFITAGSIVEERVDHVQHYTFVLEKHGKKIRVLGEGPMPDTVKDQSEVVANGRLVKAGPEQQALLDLMCEGKTVRCPIRSDAEQTWVLESSELNARCATKYGGSVSNKIDTNFK